MAKSDRFTVQKTDAEWKTILTPAQFQVARQEGTERAFTSPLNDEKRDGTFHCVGCGTALWATADKFDSGTGWHGPAPTGQRWCINGVVLVFQANEDQAG